MSVLPLVLILRDPVTEALWEGVDYAITAKEAWIDTRTAVTEKILTWEEITRQILDECYD